MSMGSAAQVVKCFHLYVSLLQNGHFLNFLYMGLLCLICHLSIVRAALSVCSYSLKHHVPLFIVLASVVSLIILLSM